MIRILALVACVGGLVGPVLGVESELSILIDSDNDVETGCDIVLSAGIVEGVEGRIDVALVSDETGSGEVTDATFRACLTDAGGFGPPSELPDNVGPVPEGLDGFNAVEIALESPFGEFQAGGLLRLAVIASNENGADAALVATNPDGSAPILFVVDAPFVPLPVPLGGVAFLLALIVLILLSVAALFRYRRIALLSLLGVSGLLLAQDAGLRFDWTEPPLAETDASNPTSGVDLRALFAQTERQGPLELRFRVDMALEAEPVDLQVQGSPLTLPTNGPGGGLTIVNLSSVAAAQDITADLAGTPLDGAVSVTGNTCDAVPPGASCTIEFQAGADPVPETGFIISGSNTREVDAAIGVDYGSRLSIAPAALSITEDETGQFEVDNAADALQAADDIEITIPAGSGLSVLANTCVAPLAPGQTCTFDVTADDPEGPTTVTVDAGNAEPVSAEVTVTAEVIELAVGGSPLILTVNGASGDLTISNLSTSNSAFNIVSDFSGTALEGNVIESDNTCTAVAPGADCTISFTAGSTVVPETDFVLQGDNTASISAAIEVQSGSTLTVISPTIGTAAGGTGVTLTGTGLTGATGVQFDGIAATSLNVVNSTTVTAVTPIAAPGVVDVVIDTPAGGATLADGYTYEATAVGQPSGGGTIACLNGGLQNLIAATADNETGIEWGGSGTAIGAGAQSDVDGASNTAAVVAELGGGAGYSAQLCNDFEVDSQGNSPCQPGNSCYNDWFLPARDQLNCLFDNRPLIGGFANDSYWTSTEFSGDPTGSAWLQSFLDGASFVSDKSFNLRVRCARSFMP